MSRAKWLTWLIQQIIPPSIITYIVVAGRSFLRDVTYGYLYVGHGRVWVATTQVLIWSTLPPSILAVFLRLYFLPRRQNVPPPLPPRGISDLKEVFECVPSEQALAKGYALVRIEDVDQVSDDGYSDPPRIESGVAWDLLDHCTKGSCGGRWKPARSRHCSECGVCRAGFDHHCAFLANCLTAPYMRAFLALCFLTPTMVLVTCSCVYSPLLARCAAAWHESMRDPAAVKWWSSKLTWILPCGPVGRWVGGLALGWMSLDREDGGGAGGGLRLFIGFLVLVGHALGAITLALGISTLRAILAGNLTVDIERARSHARAFVTAAEYTSRGEAVPPSLQTTLDRFTVSHWFFVPLHSSNSKYAGVVLPCLPGERPYDLGLTANFDLVVSGNWHSGDVLARAGRSPASAFSANGDSAATPRKDWTRFISWILPWNAVRASMTRDQTLNWPIAPAVRSRLEAEGRRIAASGGDGSVEW